MIYSGSQPAYWRKRREARIRERQIAARAYNLIPGLIAHLLCDVIEELRDEVSELNSWESQVAYAMELKRRLDELVATDEDYAVLEGASTTIVSLFAARIVGTLRRTHQGMDKRDFEAYRLKVVERAGQMSGHCRTRHIRRIRRLTYRGRREGVIQPRYLGTKMLIRREG